MKKNEMFIEEYKGFDIRFDIKTGEFKCKLSETIERLSPYIRTIKKYIDFHKESEGFNKFDIENIPDGYSERRIATVIGFSKYGTAVISKENGDGNIFNPGCYMLYKPENEPIISEIYEINKVEADLLESNNKKREELISKLDMVTLEQYRESNGFKTPDSNVEWYKW